ncbi:MAG TPA: GNAT family N-acetyltransferase, partial [Acinetobacter nosocomialis]|nr:GNAT family N-acetyltransferase [Acinetobacter nosocomialis]
RRSSDLPTEADVGIPLIPIKLIEMKKDLK